MSQLAYLVPLVSIIVGLGLADLIQSFRELVRPNRAVRWHWLPLLWSAFTFLLVLQVWWTSFGILSREAFGDVLVFLPYLLVVVELYLACSFALPDPDWTAEPTASERADRDAPPPSDAALDLKAFYFSSSHRRWFFGTLIGIVVLFEIISLSYILIKTDSNLLEYVRRRWGASVHLGGAAFSLFFVSSIGG